MSGKAMIQQSFNRIEKKYLITPAQKEMLQRKMASFVKESMYSRYTIGNIYYDTADYTMLRTSIEGPVYKEKLRMRSYRTPREGDEVFLEIKKKYDGVVYKRRTGLPHSLAKRSIVTHRGTGNDQIGSEIGWFLNRYSPEPKVMIAYEREAYEGLEDPELRITFDTDIRWRDTDLDLGHGTCGLPLLSDNRILLEIKIPDAAPLWLAGLLSSCGIFPVSFSKVGTWYRDCFMNHKHYNEQEVRHSA